MCCVQLALDRLLCTHLGSMGCMRRGFSQLSNPTALSRWWAPIIKGEKAICDCHYLHDMTVRLREVLARPWIGECVFLVLRWPEPVYERVGCL